MDRDKLIDIITEANAFYVTNKEEIGYADRYEMSGKIADALIANGIGDISAEKHRAEEALRIVCRKIPPYSENICRGECNDYPDITCHDEQCLFIMSRYYKKQAEERLKEKKE